MDKVFAESKITKHDVELLAFGRGPGAFTGIRVATALTQGLSVGLKLPVAPVSDLLNLAYQQHKKVYRQSCSSLGRPFRYAVAVDARMQEIYCCVIEFIDKEYSEYSYSYQEALIKPADWKLDQNNYYIALGNAFEEFPDLSKAMKINATLSDYSLVPTALATAQLGRLDYAKGKAVEAADALPVYLRNEVAWKN